MVAGELPPREQLDVTTWSDVSSRDALGLIVASVAEMVGFEAAMVSVVRGDTLFSVAVHGSPELRAAMIGLSTPLAVILADFDRSEDWGRFKYAPPRRGRLRRPVELRLARGADRRAGRLGPPRHAPGPALRRGTAALIGVLAIDLPLSRRHPDAAQRRLMERYAAQAERLLQIAVERDGLAERLRLAEAARQVMQFATTQDELEGALDECRGALLTGFRADDVSVRTYGDGDFPDGGTAAAAVHPGPVAGDPHAGRAVLGRAAGGRRLRRAARLLEPADHEVVIELMNASTRAW